MYVRKRIGRRRSFYQKHRTTIVFLVCAGTFLFGLALANIIRRTRVPSRLKTPISAEAPRLVPQFQPANHERLVYPYSVIPGGVRSREELSLNIEQDPVVASHYAGFQRNEARIVKSEESQFVHVSYRLRNKVYWTAKTVKIPKGETLITDGIVSARTRCGNQISVLPQEPVSEEEPPPETFEVPIIARAEPPTLDLARLPEGELEFQPNVPIIPIIPMEPPRILPYYYRPLFVVNPPGVDVPEPGTLILLATGLAGVLAFRFVRKK